MTCKETRPEGKTAADTISDADVPWVWYLEKIIQGHGMSWQVPAFIDIVFR